MTKKERFAVASTILEMKKRGYSRAESTAMIKRSYLMERLRMDHVFFFHYGEDQWADWVIEDCEHLGRIEKELEKKEVAIGA